MSSYLSSRRHNDSYSVLNSKMVLPVAFQVGALGAVGETFAPLFVTVTRVSAGLYDIDFAGELPPVDQIAVRSFNNDDLAVQWVRQSDTSIRVNHAAGTELADGSYASFVIIMPKNGRNVPQDGGRTSLAIGDMPLSCMFSAPRNLSFNALRGTFTGGELTLLDSARGVTVSKGATGSYVFNVGRYPEGACIGAFTDDGEPCVASYDGAGGTFTIQTGSPAADPADDVVVEVWFFAKTSS